MEAGGSEQCDLIEADASERENGDIDFCAGDIFFQLIDAENGARPRVRGSRENGGVGNKVGAVGLSAGGFAGFVGGVSDEPLRAEEFTRVGDRDVVFTYVHAVGAGEERYVGAVADEESATGGTSNVSKHACVFEERCVVDSGWTVLKEADSAFHGGVGDFENVAAVAASVVGNQIEGNIFRGRRLLPMYGLIYYNAVGLLI